MRNMQLKALVTLFAVIFFKTASARGRCPSTAYLPPQSTTIVVIQNEETPNMNCCVRKCTRSCEELILPPMRAELARGLGYFPAAVPLVASCYEPAAEVAGVCCEATVPVVSPCSTVTIAAPLCSDWASLVRPIIL